MQWTAHLILVTDTGRRQPVAAVVEIQVRALGALLDSLLVFPFPSVQRALHSPAVKGSAALSSVELIMALDSLNSLPLLLACRTPYAGGDNEESRP